MTCKVSYHNAKEDNNGLRVLMHVMAVTTVWDVITGTCISVSSSLSAVGLAFDVSNGGHLSIFNSSCVKNNAIMFSILHAGSSLYCNPVEEIGNPVVVGRVDEDWLCAFYLCLSSDLSRGLLAVIAITTLGSLSLLYRYHLVLTYQHASNWCWLVQAGASHVRLLD